MVGLQSLFVISLLHFYQMDNYVQKRLLSAKVIDV